MAPDNNKPWYESMTLWFNLCVMILVGLESALRYGVGQGFLPEDATILITIIGNVLLRFKTNKGVSVR